MLFTNLASINKQKLIFPVKRVVDVEYMNLKILLKMHSNIKY